ncbi:MAG: hypothetical protein NWF09_07620 [Candidatus Bathyarchaeota archaeon]|nr:hypothetical protein [Candidatus Bathyarchaeota archaeon]
MFFKLRPSSHSDDYTIIAKYKNKKEAIKVKEALKKLLRDMEENDEKYDIDWCVYDALMQVKDCNVIFTINTCGCLDDVEAVMKAANPSSLNIYTDYQHIIISVYAPKHVTLSALPLILSLSEAKIIGLLAKICGNPKIRETKNRTVFSWEYMGNAIYDEWSESLFGKPISELKNFKITIKR